MTASRSTQQMRSSSRSWLLLCASLLLLLLPTIVSGCTSSSDCHGAVCVPSSPSGSSGSCSCSDNSYEADGQLSSSAASPSCSDTASSLYPSYFLAHRVLLLLLWCSLCLLSLLCLRRLHRTSQATARTLPSLLLLLLVALSKLAYNACDPLNAAGILPSLLSLLFLFMDDVALLAAYCLLFCLLRDLLLLSPLVSDSQYARLVHTAHMLRLSLACCIVLLSVLLAALWVGKLRPVYLALVVAFIAAFTASMLSKLYRLAARDRRAVRRVSMASVAPLPLPVKPAAESAISVEAKLRPSLSMSPTISQSAAANGSSVTAASSSQLAPSPQSSQLSSSQPSAEDQNRKPLSSHKTDSTHAGAASQPAVLPLGGGAVAEGQQNGRRQSTMVVVEAGSKPIKTYSVDRVNVRRLLRLHSALALAFLVYYVALLCRVSTADVKASSFFSTSLSAVSAITVHLTKDVLHWLWCCVVVATVWPSSLAVQKASARRERRATIHAAASAAGTAERPSHGVREELSALVQQNPVLATSGTRGSLDSQHAVNVAAAVDDDDDDDDEQSAAENSRARAIALMSSTAAFMQTLDSRSSLAFAVSASPTSAVLYAPPIPGQTAVQPFSLSDDPTALLEPPCVLPADQQQQLPFAPSNRGLTAVRHSLPAIQIDPIILARVMRTMTEPSTPKDEDGSSLHSPAAAGGAAGGGSSSSLGRLPRPEEAKGGLLLREAERDDAGGLRSAPRQSSMDAGAGSKRPPSASSRAARPVSASRASVNSAVQSQSYTVPAAAAAGGGGVMMGGGSFGGFEPEQERERSRFESLLKETISPRTTSSKGSRQRRIFAPSSAEMDQ